MELARTDVVILDSSSSGAFTASFVKPFSKEPRYVAAIGNMNLEGVGIIGFPGLPSTVNLVGSPGGSVQIRINSLGKTQVHAEVLVNSLGPGQKARVNFIAKK